MKYFNFYGPDEVPPDGPTIYVRSGRIDFEADNRSYSLDNISGPSIAELVRDIHDNEQINVVMNDLPTYILKLLPALRKYSIFPTYSSQP